MLKFVKSLFAGAQPTATLSSHTSATEDVATKGLPVEEPELGYISMIVASADGGDELLVSNLASYQL
jgi:hypothetical protein